MRISQLGKRLLEYYEAGTISGRGKVSVLLLGPPGIGKSTGVREFSEAMAKKLNKEFIDYSDDVAEKILEEPSKYFVFNDFRLTEIEPSDLAGIPFRDNGAVKFAPLLWAKCMSKVAGTLVLDEITNINRADMISASYKIIFDHKAGYTKFGDEVFVIACGNRPEHASVANMLPVPLIGRLVVLSIEAPKIDEWYAWMDQTYKDEWDKKCYAFLKRFEDEFYLLKLPKENETLEAHAEPRTWTMLSALRYHGVTDAETIRGLVGEEIGRRLESFLKINIDLDELLDNPESWNAFTVDSKYMTSIMLSSWISQHISSYKKVFPLIDKMSSESKEFLVITSMGITRKNLMKFLKDLIQYNASYKKCLEDITSILKDIQF